MADSKENNSFGESFKLSRKALIFAIHISDKFKGLDPVKG